MQFYHPFFPNYPPPPIPTRETIISEGLKALEQSKTDQQWLKTWLERRKKPSPNPVSLSDYRQKLIQHARLLQQYKQSLQNSNHEYLFHLKTQIEQSNHFIYDCNTIKTIQKQIHRRKSKRLRLRRQQQTKLTNTQNNNIEQQPTNEKSTIEKIQDINSILQTIEQLKTLRQQRQNDDTDTNDELTEIQSICNAKLLEYQTEMEKTSQSPHVEMYNYLFNNQNRSFYEASDSDAQYLLRAHQSINDLVKIRQAWDRYSSTQISSPDNIIPCKWHELQTPCDSNWAQYIFNKKE